MHSGCNNNDFNREHRWYTKIAVGLVSLGLIAATGYLLWPYGMTVGLISIIAIVSALVVALAYSIGAALLS